VSGPGRAGSRGIEEGRSRPNERWMMCGKPENGVGKMRGNLGEHRKGGPRERTRVRAGRVPDSEGNERAEENLTRETYTVDGNEASEPGKYTGTTKKEGREKAKGIYKISRLQRAKASSTPEKKANEKKTLNLAGAIRPRRRKNRSASNRKSGPLNERMQQYNQENGNKQNHTTRRWK